MSDQPQVTQDGSGVTRTADGTLAADQSNRSLGTTPPPNSDTNNQQTNQNQNTNQETNNTSLLNSEGNKKQEPEKKEGDGAAKVVPDAYADFKLPDGYELDGEVKTSALGMFKQWGLSQDEAQAAIDFYVKHTQEAAEAPINFYLDTRKAWIDEVKASPDLGPKFNEVKSTIGRAIATLPPEVQGPFKQAMDITGAGDNPAFIRAFYHFAQQLTEGRPVRGNSPSPNGQNPGGRNTPAPTTAQALYPNLPSTAR